MRTPAEIYASEVFQRNKAKLFASQAAALRKEAKACKVLVDAHGMRLQAKDLSKEASAARGLAKSYHAEARNALELCAVQLVQRMPPCYPTWGIMKTRGYMKLLEIVATNAKLVNPKLGVATEAHTALLRHAQWSDDEASRYGNLQKNPKSI